MLSSAGARRTLAPVIALLKVPSSEQKIRSSFGIPDQRRVEPSTLVMRSIILLSIELDSSSILLCRGITLSQPRWLAPPKTIRVLRHQRHPLSTRCHGSLLACSQTGKRFTVVQQLAGPLGQESARAGRLLGQIRRGYQKLFQVTFTIFNSALDRPSGWQIILPFRGSSLGAGRAITLTGQAFPASVNPAG